MFAICREISRSKKSRFNPVAKHAAKYNKAAVFVPRKFKKPKYPLDIPNDILEIALKKGNINE